MKKSLCRTETDQSHLDQWGLWRLFISLCWEKASAKQDLFHNVQSVNFYKSGSPSLLPLGPFSEL